MTARVTCEQREVRQQQTGECQNHIAAENLVLHDFQDAADDDDQRNEGKALVNVLRVPVPRYDVMHPCPNGETYDAAQRNQERKPENALVQTATIEQVRQTAHERRDQQQNTNGHGRLVKRGFEPGRQNRPHENRAANAEHRTENAGTKSCQKAPERRPGTEFP